MVGMKKGSIVVVLGVLVLILLLLGAYFFLPVAPFSVQGTRLPTFDESVFTKTNYALNVRGISYASESAALQVRSVVKGYLFNKIWLTVGNQNFSLSLPSTVSYGCVPKEYKDVFVDLTQSRIRTEEVPFRSIQKNIRIGDEIGMILDLDNTHLVSRVPLVVDYKCD